MTAPAGPWLQNEYQRGAADALRAARALEDVLEDAPLLTRLAERLEPAARRSFVSAVREARGHVELEALIEAVRSGRLAQIEAAALLDALPLTLQERLLPVIGRAFAVGAQVGIDALGPAAAARVSFDLSNPEAIRWVQARAGALVTEVTGSTRAGIRALVDAAFREGTAPGDLAREIREVIGLHSRQVAAVDTFRERLIGDGVGGDALDRRVERYADAQLRHRAETIARTETLDGSNAGQQELWRAARGQGLLDPHATRRVWIVTHDDRLDTMVCEPLDGAEATLDGTFPGGYHRPPAHPRCRCAVGLRIG